MILGFLPPETEQDRGLMVACEENDDELLEQQLNAPRSPNFQDANQKTPLHVAASNGSLKCVLLLEAGADKGTGRTDIGQTPLHAAAQRGHLEVVRFLVESGANKERTDSWKLFCTKPWKLFWEKTTAESRIPSSTIALIAVTTHVFICGGQFTLVQNNIDQGKNGCSEWAL